MASTDGSIIQLMDSENNVGNVQEHDDTSRQFDFVSPCASNKQATERDLRVAGELTSVPKICTSFRNLQEARWLLHLKHNKLLHLF